MLQRALPLSMMGGLALALVAFGRTQVFWVQSGFLQIIFLSLKCQMIRCDPNAFTMLFPASALHGFRPGRSAHDALRTIWQHLKEGQTAVYDADLAGYFDSIPQDKLIACVRMRVVDGSVLGRIRGFWGALGSHLII